MQVGIIGLGNMGAAIASHALKAGLEIVGYNRSKEKTEALVSEGLIPAYSLEELVKQLKPPRIIWLMLSVGQPIEEVLFGITPLLNKEGQAEGRVGSCLQDLLQPNDIIIDGANSHYRDSQRRTKQLAEKNIHYLDCGTSGGIEGTRQGASLMIGGNEQAFKTAEPIFKALAAPDGYGYFGQSGAGHFVKMVHNGIEYGMLQALAEGMAILEASEFKPDLTKATQVWSHGSIIESKLVKWLAEILEKDSNLNKVEPVIGSLGTGKWTVEAAMDLGIPANVIAAAVFARYESRPEATFGKKVVQALREHFGGHTIHERDVQ